MKKKYVWAVLTALVGTYISAQDSLNTHKLGQYEYTESLSDIWGYATGSGMEYALVGAYNGFSVVDVSTPSAPVEKLFIPGALSIWRDIKTYEHYAYVIHDNYQGSSDGIMIVDLDSMDAPSPTVQYFFPEITIDTVTEQYNKSHNIYIDENGILYVFGSNIGRGGALMFDLKPDPENPVYLGIYNTYYLHDGMARGDTLWGSAVNDGVFVVVDVHNKSVPVDMASHNSPSSFTHNCWISDDGNTLFTTDELSGAYIGAYDVSDLNDIEETDRIKISYGGNDVIPHNTHVYGDFLVTSYYTSGLQIIDASMPDILVETAFYDTSPYNGNGFHGAWGAYPYLPSGNILVSDVEEGLFILSSSYPKACYFTGSVKDSLTGNPLSLSGVEVIASPLDSLVTDIFGKFAVGSLTGGNFQAVFAKPGYQSDTVAISLVNGVEEHVEVALLPIGFSLIEDKTPKINLYPNPSEDHFEINLSGEVPFTDKELVITNLSGKTVLRKTVHFSGNRIRVGHDLVPGIYIVQLHSPDLNHSPVKLIVGE